MSQQKPLTYSCQPPGLKKCFIKGQALRHLRTDSSQTTSEENIKKFENRQIERGSSVPVVRKYSMLPSIQTVPVSGHLKQELNF